MKHYPLLLFALLLCCHVYSQDYKIERKVVPLVAEQSFYLNGGVRANMGGKSRESLEITLPNNTVEWYYSFSTSTTNQGQKNLHLAAQLTKLFDPTGVTAMAAESILAPSGTASADILVTDRQNLSLFLQKADQNGGVVNYYRPGSRQNFKQGIVVISEIKKGNVCIGLRNPSAMEGVSVSIEVAAIVEEKIPIAKSESQTKAELYGNMGWQAYEKGDYEKCIELSKKALELENKLPWVKCNIALCHLVQNKSECMDSYVDAIAACKKSSDSKAYLQAAIKDINDAQKRIGVIPNSNDIIQLIKNELR